MTKDDLEQIGISYINYLSVNSSLNIFSKIAYASLKLIFQDFQETTNNHTLIRGLTYLDLTETLQKGDGIAVRFYDDSMGRMVFELFRNSKVLYSQQSKFIITKASEIKLKNFAVICTKVALDKIMEILTNPKEGFIKNTNLNEIIPTQEKTIEVPVGFTSKVKAIYPTEELCRYQIDLENGTNHFILGPIGLNFNIKPGDFAYSDGSGQITFIDQMKFN